jgi:hypothetical protein
MAVVLAAGIAAGFVACRQYMPTNRYLQMRRSTQNLSTADARGKFNHQSHDKPLAAKGVACVDCHRFDLKIETAQADVAKELSAHGMHPGSTACHTCHTAEATRMAGAPSTCITCHENLLALRPKDHDLSWERLHASIARTEPASCENCHSQNECVDCHERRDTIQTRVHERNFRFFHSIAARANPMQCGSCHREDYCIGCHQQGKVQLQ